jgi:hypothetical protein
MSTSLLHLPSFQALQPQSRCRSFPAALLQLVLVSLSSRIKPLVEMSLEALEHLFLNVFDVGEPVPTSDIAVLRTLKLPNEFFHVPAGPGIFPGGAACKCPPSVSAGPWFLIPYCAPNFCTGAAHYARDFLLPNLTIISSAVSSPLG